MTQLAWLWLRHRPHSALAQWYRERVKRDGGRVRKTTIVARARKLLVAFWKYEGQGPARGSTRPGARRCGRIEDQFGQPAG